jgi:RHS repeat-associated protein
LPTGVAATADVITAYNNFATAQVGNGQISHITDGQGSESYLYDSVARVSSKTRVIGSRSYQTQYQYNTANQLTVLIYPSGKRVRTNHDTRGRMNGLDKVDAQGNFLAQYMTSVGYNTAGQIASVGLVNGVSESYGYSPTRLQLTSQSASKSGNPAVMDLTYGYQSAAGDSGVGTHAGNSGQLMSITGTVNQVSRNQTFKYDNVGRLVYASGNGTGWQRRYTYDRWGNRTKVEQWAQTQVPGIFEWCPTQIAFYTRDINGVPTTNRMTEVDKIQECDATSVAYLQYAGAGNETVENSMTCTYDGEGRMTHIVAESGGLDVVGDYSYDAGNRRVKKTVNGGLPTHYVYEGGQVIAEYNGSNGALICEYICGGSRMVARDQGGVLRYYHQDRLSTRLITDTSGGVKGTMHHEPFGEDGGVAGETEKHRFTSYERDEGNTDYAMNRQFETANGRFMRPDPIEGSSPQSLNRYAYAANDPVNLIDPSGLNLAVPGYCPPEFGSCGQATAFLPGLGYVGVTVGYDGSGGGTFLWNQSSLTQHDYHYAYEILGINLLTALPRGFFQVPTLSPGTPPLPEEYQRLLRGAFGDAVDALSKPDCAALFDLPNGVTPQGVLFGLVTGLGGLGGITFGPTSALIPATATTARGGTSSMTPPVSGGGTVRRSIFTSQVTLDSAGDFVNGFGGRNGLGDSENRALVLIHELGHALNNMFGNGSSQMVFDGYPGDIGRSVSRVNSTRVRRACFP